MMPSQGNRAYGTRSDESTKLQTQFAQHFLILLYMQRRNSKIHGLVVAGISVLYMIDWT